jgi:hypothetical protein
MAVSPKATSSSPPTVTSAPAVNPLSLSLEEMAKVLSAGGGRKVTVEQIQEDIAAGAPVGRDGTMSLVAYAAWLSQENQRKAADEKAE